jgi:hypothetical protein
MKEIKIDSLIEVTYKDGSVEDGKVIYFSEEGIYMHDGKEGWLVEFKDIKKVVRLEWLRADEPWFISMLKEL